jgi:hypothetical protein
MNSAKSHTKNLCQAESHWLLKFGATGKLAMPRACFFYRHNYVVVEKTSKAVSIPILLRFG